ncbi:MAG TPA: methanogenesis marker 8 protein [Methanoregulaceae archaeon]|nr:methanogenesis marker 8 protein [Methanoregulaceae archaeon]
MDESNHSPDEHILEAIGRCRIVVRDGKVVEVGEPLIRRCPLARRFARPVDPITPEAVKANIEHRIMSFGMCTPDRKVVMDGEFVGFGASEMLSYGLRNRMLDCAVIAAEGAGTIITANPGLVQGIGGRMSGLVCTTPIPEIISRIEENGGDVLDHSGAVIDQVRGVAKAQMLGFSSIGVTVATAHDAEAIRKIDQKSCIIAVHTTGITPNEAERLARSADIITACASSAIREIASTYALLQAGSSIPVFAVSQKGKDLILEKVRTGKDQVVVMGAKLPYSGDNFPDPLI